MAMEVKNIGEGKVHLNMPNIGIVHELDKGKSIVVNDTQGAEISKMSESLKLQVVPTDKKADKNFVPRQRTREEKQAAVDAIANSSNTWASSQPTQREVDAARAVNPDGFLHENEVVPVATPVTEGIGDATVLNAADAKKVEDATAAARAAELKKIDDAKAAEVKKAEDAKK